MSSDGKVAAAAVNPVIMQITRNGQIYEVIVRECVCAEPRRSPVCDSCGNWYGSWHMCECPDEAPAYMSRYGMHDNICAACHGHRPGRSLVLENTIPWSTFIIGSDRALQMSGSEGLPRRTEFFEPTIRFPRDTDISLAEEAKVDDVGVPDLWSEELFDETMGSFMMIRTRDESAGPGLSMMVPAQLCMCIEPNVGPFCIDCGLWIAYGCECGIYESPGYETHFGIHDDICRNCVGLIDRPEDSLSA